MILEHCLEKKTKKNTGFLDACMLFFLCCCFYVLFIAYLNRDLPFDVVLVKF